MGKAAHVCHRSTGQDRRERSFVPGQTVESEDGTSEYTPGITIFMDNEPTLIPGWCSAKRETCHVPARRIYITEEGQLKFEANDEDVPPHRRKKREFNIEVREEDIPKIEHRRRSPSSSPSPPPQNRAKPKPRQEKEIVIHRRVFDEPEEPVRKERVKKRAPVVEMKPKEPEAPREVFRPRRQPLEDPLKLMEEQRIKREEEEKND
jgi:hypothetical protein